jgi:hypothetical protein
MCGTASCSKPLCTWSEAWRKECEVRFLKQIPEEDRIDYFKGVELKRGRAAAVELWEATKK